jgi:hypothetical protein
MPWMQGSGAFGAEQLRRAETNLRVAAEYARVLGPLRRRRPRGTAA